jgi:hypothetical protein
MSGCASGTNEPSAFVIEFECFTAQIVRAVRPDAQSLRASISLFIGNLAFSGVARSLRLEIEPIKWQRACAVGKTNNNHRKFYEINSNDHVVRDGRDTGLGHGQSVGAR